MANDHTLAGRTGAQRLLDPAVLARIGNLDLVSRRVVDGFLSGTHQAVNLGSSTEFAEYRSYTPGDDVRRIDWRVYGRTDRLYIKTFEAETNADVVVALDTSASMGFASGGISKSEYASMLAASLVHLAASQRDRVGFIGFTAGITERIPCAGRHRDRIIRTLAGIEPAETGNVTTALNDIGDRLGRRGIVIVISDFYAEPDVTARALEELAGRGQDVVAVHILDPLERDLDLAESRLLEDMESGERVPVSPTSRDEYATLIRDHIDSLSAKLGARRIDYLSCATNEPLDHVLFEYLSSRNRLGKFRR